MAIVRIRIISTDLRWTKEIRFLGIPIYHRQDLVIRDNTPRPIGFQRIGNDAPIVLDDNPDVLFYGNKED